MSNTDFDEFMAGVQETPLEEKQAFLVADDISTNINAPLFGTITKDNISMGAAAIAKLSQEHGVISPLELHVKLKAIKAMCDEALGLIEEDAKTDANRDKEQSVCGALVAYKRGASNYKYDNSPAIAFYEAKVKAAKELAKVLAKNGQGAVVDADTGEVIEPAILDMAKDTITVKFQ